MTTRVRGFTIIEFMIAITLSLLVLAALTAAFVANSRSRTEIERANEQMESGRFALQILTDDIEVAGFYSQFNIDNALGYTPGLLPDAIVPPCVTALSSATNEHDDLNDAFPLHIQGYDLPDAALDTDAEAAALGLGCLADIDYGSDIIVIRRTSTCVAGTPNCAAVQGAPYFQASLCGKGDELNTGDGNNFFRIVAANVASDGDEDPDAVDTAALNTPGSGDNPADQLHARDCATVAPSRQLLTHIYYVSTHDQDNDGIPTLKRAELGNAANAGGFTVVPLAHGIQILQVEYGIDTNGDGAPDEFDAEPANVAAWRNVVTVRLSLLSRNSTETQDYVDEKTYNLVDGAHGPFTADDQKHYKRHAYQTTVRLMNPAGRREQ